MKKYNIVYADPPWEYKQKGSRGTAINHYKTMTTNEICRLSIKEIIEEQALLFLWSTFPNIKEALKVMEAWGFIYKTAAFVWIKKNKRQNTNFWGMGAYTRANIEPCLLGITKKTKANTFVKNHGIHQIIEYPVLKHSEKPPIVRDRIINLCGDISKIELFARTYTNGWDVWGSEVKNSIEIKEELFCYVYNKPVSEIKEKRCMISPCCYTCVETEGLK